MFGWKVLLNMLLPMLESIGQAKIAEDANSTGKDDLIGESLVFAAKLLRAIVEGKDLPKAPNGLR